MNDDAGMPCLCETERQLKGGGRRWQRSRFLLTESASRLYFPVMNLLRFTVLLVTAGYLLVVLSDFPCPHPFPWFPPLVANAIMLPLSLLLFMVMEKWAETMNGGKLPLIRRMLIPVPAILFLSGVLMINSNPDSPYFECNKIVTLNCLWFLPFALMAEKVSLKAFLAFILGIWSSYAVWQLIVTAIINWMPNLPKH